MSLMEPTRQSIFEHLRGPESERAWEEFYQRYWEPIVRYAQKLGLRDSEAQDVLQETMIALMRILPGFQYDPGRGKFRNFLLTIVHRKALAGLRRTARHPEISLEETQEEGGGGLRERLAAAPESTAAADEERWRQCLIARALRIVREDPEVDTKTFQVFQGYVVEGRPCAEVARQFGEKENNVYQIKNRLLRRLRQEVALLAEGDERAEEEVWRGADGP